jgi:nitroreductase
MEFLETILSRRSVREHTDEPVSEEAIEQLLRAAMNAPSAGNQQPWHFIVVRDRSRLQEIARAHTYAQMLRTAPAAILVCGDLRLERAPGLWVQDCSAATQNILLAAQALGLGAVWVGVHPDPARVEMIRGLFGIPEHVVPLCLVPIGHPASWEPREERFDPTRIRRDRW